MATPTKAYAVYSTVGIEFVLSIFFGLFVGRWADGKLGTGSALALFGFFVGTAAGFRAIWRAAQRMQRDAERDAEHDPSSPPDDPPSN